MKSSFLSGCKTDEEYVDYFKIHQNVFNDQMFHQFVSFTPDDNKIKELHDEASRIWILSGGFLGIFSIPILTFGVFSNLLTIFLLLKYLRSNGKQQVYSIILCILHIIQLSFCLIIVDYLSVGKVWLRGSGLYIDQYSPMSCKYVHFFKQLLITLEMNITFLESFCRYLSIQGYGRFNPNLKIILFFLICAFSASLIICTPTFIVNNIWRLDFRFYCGPDPAWTSHIIKIYLAHRLLLVEGLFQGIATLFLNILIFKELSGYKSLNFILEKAILDTQVNSDVLIEIRNYVYFYMNETKMILVHSTISSIFSFPRSILTFKLLAEIYLNYQDNNTITGALEFYRRYGSLYLQALFYYFFISCYFWIYFFTMQSFRQALKMLLMTIFRNNSRIGHIIDLFLLGDSLVNRHIATEGTNLYEQIDAVTLQRLQHIEHKNDNAI